jgi:hypothetical protein
MTWWDMIVETEAVEEFVLCFRSLSHHRDALPDVASNKGEHRRFARRVFQQDPASAVRD